METQMGEWLIPPGKGQEKSQRRVYIWKVTESSLGRVGEEEGIPGRELSQITAEESACSLCSGNWDEYPGAPRATFLPSVLRISSSSFPREPAKYAHFKGPTTYLLI